MTFAWTECCDGAKVGHKSDQLADQNPLKNKDLLQHL